MIVNKELFSPNITPKNIFLMGSFEGRYFRPIYSSITEKSYKNKHLEFSFLKNIPKKLISQNMDDSDVQINKYKVKVGSTLEFWEQKKWITKWDVYGWVEWYCNYYDGRRCADDERQISRWANLAGPNGRFRKNLINQIKKSKKAWNDYTVSPKIRQTLLHWGYELTEKDFI